MTKVAGNLLDNSATLILGVLLLLAIAAAALEYFALAQCSNDKSSLQSGLSATQGSLTTCETQKANLALELESKNRNVSASQAKITELTTALNLCNQTLTNNTNAQMIPVMTIGSNCVPQAVIIIPFIGQVKSGWAFILSIIFTICFGFTLKYECDEKNWVIAVLALILTVLSIISTLFSIIVVLPAVIQTLAILIGNLF